MILSLVEYSWAESTVSEAERQSSWKVESVLVRSMGKRRRTLEEKMRNLEGSLLPWEFESMTAAGEGEEVAQSQTNLGTWVYKILLSHSCSCGPFAATVIFCFIVRIILFHRYLTCGLVHFLFLRAFKST
jgi:hypothetical protein